MSKQDNGGAAFPALHGVDGNWVKEPLPQFSGMTLRDYFAAKALAALINEPAWSEGTRPTVFVFDDRDDRSSGPEQFAYVAYRLADAMLKERQS